jgi:predicted phosphodiesterase
MLSEHTDLFPVAVIADVHGNRWACEAVLEDIDRRGLKRIINLGDTLTGPLDPVGTANLLMERPMLSVSGNDDYELFLPEEQLSASLRFTRDLLLPQHLEWIQQFPETARYAEDVFICHGDRFETPHILEEITEDGVFLRQADAIATSVAAISQPVVLCGHSHQARVVSLPDGKLIINPGSVGLPAYTSTMPLPHIMESGSPHARYAILSKENMQWQVDLVQVPYDWSHAAHVATSNQRPDWAAWLSTGRASLSGI